MVVTNRKPGTSTSSFGTGVREAHDSSVFYGSGFYGQLPGHKKPTKTHENSVLPEVRDRVHYGDARDMRLLPNSSVHLVVFSPPYNCGKDYDVGLSMSEYRSLMQSTMREIHRVLVCGGRVCVNVANLGRKPYIPLHRYIIEDAQDAEFNMRGEVIWQKGHAVANSSCAWGSWRSPSNPSLRDTHEYILIFCKDDYRHPKGDREPDISSERFRELTRSVWEFPPESAKRVGHPAPFPIELPKRCIELYSYPGDVVLDPFAGSGSTGLAAMRTGRVFIGYDSNQEYVDLANSRLFQESMLCSVDKTG